MQDFDFDFDANPTVNPAMIHTLSTCAWVRNGEPRCLIGDSGTGKSHLLIGLGAAAMAGYRVRYVMAAKLVKAADDKQTAIGTTAPGPPVVPNVARLIIKNGDRRERGVP
ncbi:ATP-binding protein [Dactylosporangium sp. CA-152071]|uniref:ATP-binding protein n=1 Tax=Dactylosporangium sp. CA-152071 TaxID=3239933 RepID=UPI003D8BB58B